MFLEAKFPQVRQHISIEEQQSAVLAYLGQLALSKPSVEDMLTDGLRLIAAILPADFVWWWELDSDRKNLKLRAGSVWKEGGARETHIPLETNSLEELVLQSSYPILVQELETDNRFKTSSLLQAAGATSGVAVIIGTLQRPLGVLEAFSQNRYAYSRTDVHFFHAVANILGLFMDSKHGETVGRQTESENANSKAESHEPSLYRERDQDEIKNGLVDGRERERLRLAQELHDIPVQDLYGLMYQMDDLKDLIKDPNGMEILEEFNNTLHRVVNNLRTICGELRPPSLSPFGLEVAIRDHVEKLSNVTPNLQFHLDLMRDQRVLSDNMRLRLFRIYQQAINNVIRHAQATDVHIRFRWDDQVVILEVEDNGVGFEIPGRWVDLVRQEQFGLVGIAERVESMQGELEIVSTLGAGTTVRVSVPRR